MANKAIILGIKSDKKAEDRVKKIRILKKCPLLFLIKKRTIFSAMLHFIKIRETKNPFIKVKIIKSVFKILVSMAIKYNVFLKKK